MVDGFAMAFHVSNLNLVQTGVRESVLSKRMYDDDYEETPKYWLRTANFIDQESFFLP